MLCLVEAYLHKSRYMKVATKTIVKNGKEVEVLSVGQYKNEILRYHEQVHPEYISWLKKLGWIFKKKK